MGWSCRADAARTLQVWTDACVASTGSSNVLVVKDKKYLIEVSHREHDDGAITGTILKYIVGGEWDGHVKPSGTFRIDGDGTIARAPGFLKSLSS